MNDHDDFECIFDSLNLTGQYQPSGLPDLLDSSLNDQILGDIVLTEDLRLSSNFSQNDDISNALVDSALDDFNFQAISSDVPDSPLEDDITKLLSLSFEEVPKQSTIEDSMGRMNMHQASTEILSSFSSVPMGSSPVERKEIDNSILATQYIQTQNRMYKNASKSKKTTRYESPSSSVGPIDVLSSYSGCQPCTTVQMQSDYDYAFETLQFDTMELKKIQFKCQPRAAFRPRMQAESKNASHYIRCELNEQFEYPTIYIPTAWSRQSLKNIIEVTLVAKDRQPHPYIIENKTCSSSFDDNALIFRQNELHSLYFCVTKEDFENGYKCFMIEFIKRKQDEIITKELIKARQLDQSMLRLTRIYQTEPGVFQRDEASTEYSSLMVEAYGDVAVEHMGPVYGPMAGNERVYALLKGRILKDDITIFVTEPQTGWRRQVPFTKNGNLIYFIMPAYPYSGQHDAITNITICYKGEELHQSSFLYKGSLDEALAQLNLQDSSSTANSASTSDIFDFFSVTGACPIRPSSKRSSTARSTKRLTHK